MIFWKWLLTRHPLCLLYLRMLRKTSPILVVFFLCQSSFLLQSGKFSYLYLVFHRKVRGRSFVIHRVDPSFLLTGICREHVFLLLKSAFSSTSFILTCSEESIIIGIRFAEFVVTYDLWVMRKIVFYFHFGVTS